MFIELLKLTNGLGARSRNINCPVLMLDAGNEKIVSHEASQRLFNQLTCPKEKKTYTEAWHDLMFDPVIDELVEDLSQWIGQTAKITVRKN